MPSILLRAHFPLGMNALELLLVAVTFLGAAVYCLQCPAATPRQHRIVPLYVIFIVLVIVAAETTQFLTVDDGVFVAQILDPNNRGQSQWIAGAFHSGLNFLLPIARTAQWAGASPPTIAMMLKAAWWLLGVCLFAWIAVELRKVIAPAMPHQIASTFFWCILLLLPTDNLALKTLNYDLLSTTLSIGAILLAARAVQEKNALLFPANILVAALAAQEKLSASPILLVLIVLFATHETDGHRPRRIIEVATRAIGGICIALLVGMASSLFYAALGPPVLPAGFWAMAAGPLVTWLFVPFYFFAKVTDFGSRLAELLLISTIILLSVSLVGAAVLHRISGHLVALRDSMASLARAGLATILTLGIVGLLAVSAYWNPYHPGDPAVIEHFTKFNGVVLHFGDNGLLLHRVHYLLYACAVVVAAMPSVVWLSLLPSTGRQRPLPWIVAAIVPLTLVMILVALLTNVPIAHRYLDIWLCGLAIVASGRLAIWAEGREWSKYALYLLILVAVAELFPFRPFYASFRPFWIHYDDASQAEPGRLNASWMGWGEEVMLAGKEIEAACGARSQKLAGIDCAHIVLRPYGLTGTWLPGPATIKIEPTIPGNPGKMTRTDYYLVSRLTLIQRRSIPEIAADFVVSYRGYVQAWVYRGDRLLASGYRF